MIKNKALFIILILLLFYCKKHSSEEITIKYTKLSDDSMMLLKTELENKIRSLDSEILEIISQINSVKRDINRENEHLKRDTLKTNILLKNLRDELQRTIFDSTRIEEDIRERIIELQNFISNNEFQIKISQLQRRKDEVSRLLYDIDFMIKSKNSLDKLIVQTRLKVFQEDFERFKIPEIQFPLDDIITTKDKSIIESIKSNLKLVTTHLDSLINIQQQNFNKTKEQKNNELKNQNESLQKTIAAIQDYNHRITQNERNLTITYQNSLVKIDSYQNSLKIFDARKYEKINEKYIHEISLIIKNLSSTNYKSEKLSDQIEQLRAVQIELMTALAMDQYNLAEELIKDLEEKIETFSKSVAELMLVGEIIKELFRDAAFTDYMALGKLEDSDETEIQLFNKTFYEQMPTLKTFLELYPDYKIYIDGHADRTEYIGGSYKNTKLSKQRALKADSLMRNIGIDKSKIVWDYFSKYHNAISHRELRPFERDTVINRRIEVRVIPDNDTVRTEKEIRYLKFKNQFAIENKVFEHKNGFWDEIGYKSKAGEVIKINFDHYVFKALVNRNKEFEKLMKPIQSPLYENGELQLGNQVRLILDINNKEYKIEICEEGAKTIDEIKNEVFKNYLLGIQPVAQK